MNDKTDTQEDDGGGNRRLKIAVMVMPLLVVGVIGYPVYDTTNEAAQPMYWANDNPEKVEQYEQHCNERFGYGWEFRPSEEVMDPAGDRVEITCAKDMGFLASTHEHITVPVAGS